MAKRKVLFLCTGNSCRSQMAEAIVNARLGDEWQAVSAGTRPQGYVHPWRCGRWRRSAFITRAGPSQRMSSADADFDLVVTVCDSAAEECPVWLGKGKRVHQGFVDPFNAQGTDEEKMRSTGRCATRSRVEIPRAAAGPFLTWEGHVTRRGHTQAIDRQPLSDAVDLPGHGAGGGAGIPLPGCGAVVQHQLFDRHHQHPDRHRPDPDDVPAAGQGALRRTGRCVPQLEDPGPFAAAELGDRPDPDVRCWRSSSCAATPST